MFSRSKFDTCFHLLLPLIAFGVKHSVSSFFVGVDKLLLLCAVAGLLMFLASHSEDICRQLIAYVESVCLYVFEPAGKAGLSMPQEASLTLPWAPRLRLSFQLPPPSSL
jgi:hypothetical protein